MVVDGELSAATNSTSIELEVHASHVNVGYELECTTNLLDPYSWSAVDSDENAPFFSSTNILDTIQDTVGSNETLNYYRMRIYEP